MGQLDAAHITTALINNLENFGRPCSERGGGRRRDDGCSHTEFSLLLENELHVFALLIRSCQKIFVN